MSLQWHQVLFIVSIHLPHHLSFLVFSSHIPSQQLSILPSLQLSDLPSVTPPSTGPSEVHSKYPHHYLLMNQALIWVRHQVCCLWFYLHMLLLLPIIQPKRYTPKSPKTPQSSNMSKSPEASKKPKSSKSTKIPKDQRAPQFQRIPKHQRVAKHPRVESHY